LFILHKKEEDVEAAKTIFKRSVGNTYTSIAALTIVFLIITIILAFFYFRINFTYKVDRYIFQGIIVLFAFCTSVLSFTGSIFIIQNGDNNHIKILSGVNLGLIMTYFIGGLFYLIATHKE
jgi:hypothetical protein